MNFLCISNYNNDLDWLREYPNPHLIYDKTWNGGVLDNDNSGELPPTNLRELYPEYNITNASSNGYNISDYMDFIIDHYDNLPEVTAFIKGNIFPRHLSKETFDRIINNKTFTPIEDWRAHDPNQGSLISGYAMISCDGGFMETNDSWYLNHPKHPTKYFRNYNDFLRFCFKDPVIPKYLRFPPGGNFVVPKEYILKYEKVFYQNLKTFTDHSRVSGEGQMIERALHTIWTCNFEVADSMKKLV
jgi:hypothetical protein